MSAPRDYEQLPAYVDSALLDLRRDLEQRYAPIFLIVGEESGALVVDSYQFSFGANAVAAADQGIVLPFRCWLFVMSLNLAGASARASVIPVKDGVAFDEYIVEASAGNEAYVEYPNPLEYHPGSVFNLRSGPTTVASTSARVGAWFRRD